MWKSLKFSLSRVSIKLSFLLVNGLLTAWSQEVMCILAAEHVLNALFFQFIFCLLLPVIYLKQKITLGLFLFAITSENKI